MVKRFIDGLFLTKREKIGYTILIIITILFLLGKYFLPFFAPSSPTFTQEQINQILAQENKSQAQVENPKNQLQPFIFNPNEVTLAELDSMNLPEFFSNNLIRYIESGGYLKAKSDLKKIYGMNDSIYKSIVKFIDLPNKELNNSKKKSNSQESIKKQKKSEENKLEIIKPQKTPNFSISINFDKPEKLMDFGLSDYTVNNLLEYREKGGIITNIQELKTIYGIDTTFIKTNKILIDFSVPVENFSFELNKATIEELDKIPGIGQAYAKRINLYNEKLGGFCTLKQINEVYGLSNFDIEKYETQISINISEIKKLNINSISFNELLKHPYFDYAAVKSIFDLKDKRGDLTIDIIQKEALLDPKYRNYYPYYLDFSDE